ncbi:hypothetical protein BpHYR1_007736 [Brachionus plicatilis]|uniref:Uncharacterized protein n=1 Tax=Brachionus plicatilis TaxID=10195 RepID=A0A3M7QNR3_BRAPC|nr:hypothetical protein BpHYR1_007736 [Brachionus plicatilis]
MLSNRNLNDVTPVTTSQAQTQRFQLSGRYVLNDLNSQLQSQPRPQPVVNNTDSQENTALKKKGSTFLNFNRNSQKFKKITLTWFRWEIFHIEFRLNFRFIPSMLGKGLGSKN